MHQFRQRDETGQGECLVAERRLTAEPLSQRNIAGLKCSDPCGPSTSCVPAPA